jgi:hypothetical protein
MKPVDQSTTKANGNARDAGADIGMEPMMHQRGDGE